MTFVNEQTDVFKRFPAKCCTLEHKSSGRSTSSFWAVVAEKLLQKNQTVVLTLILRDVGREHVCQEFWMQGSSAVKGFTTLTTRALILCSCLAPARRLLLTCGEALHPSQHVWSLDSRGGCSWLLRCVKASGRTTASLPFQFCHYPAAASGSPQIFWWPLQCWLSGCVPAE